MAQQASDYCVALNTHFTDTVHQSLVEVDDTRGELMNAYGQLGQAGVAYAKLDADVQVYQTTMEGKVAALRQYLGGEEAMRAQLVQDYRDMSTNSSVPADELRTELAASTAKCQFLQHNELTLSDMLQLSEAHASRLREAVNTQNDDVRSRETMLKERAESLFLAHRDVDDQLRTECGTAAALAQSNAENVSEIVRLTEGMSALSNMDSGPSALQLQEQVEKSELVEEDLRVTKELVMKVSNTMANVEKLSLGHEVGHQLAEAQLATAEEKVDKMKNECLEVERCATTAITDLHNKSVEEYTALLSRNVELERHVAKTQRERQVYDQMASGSGLVANDLDDSLAAVSMAQQVTTRIMARVERMTNVDG